MQLYKVILKVVNSASINYFLKKVRKFKKESDKEPDLELPGRWDPVAG
jgi:hypothetical protein